MFKLLALSFKIDIKHSLINVILNIIFALLRITPIFVSYFLYDNVDKYLNNYENLIIVITIICIDFLYPIINFDLINTVINYNRIKIRTKLEKYYLNEYYGNLQNINYRDYEKEENSNDLYFIKNNVIPNLIDNSFILVEIICSILTFVISMLYIASLNYLLVIIAILIAVPYILIDRKFGLNSYYKVYRQLKEIRHANYLYYLLTNKDNKKEMMIDRTYNIFKNKWEKDYKDINKEALKLRCKTIYITILYDLIYNIIKFSSILLIFYYDGIVFAASVFLATLSSFNNINSKTRDLSSSFSKIKLLRINQKKYKEYFQKYRKNKEFASNISNIELKNVSFSYDDEEVLTNINLKLKRGVKYVLVGKNGSGKSTLAKIIGGIYKPITGRISVNGANISEYKGSYLQQHSVIFEGTIKENIVFDKKIDNEKLNGILDLLNLKKFIETLPNGVDTYIGELNDNSTHLSGGQIKKINIARALYNDDDVLILDEPTSSLDQESENHFIERINNYLKDKITIIITHHLNLIDGDCQIICLKDGRIIEQGRHADLIKINDGEYRNLYLSEIKML